MSRDTKMEVIELAPKQAMRVLVLLAAVLLLAANASAQTASPVAPVPQPKPSASAQFISQTGLDVRQLVEIALARRVDLQAARQRLAIAEGNLVQAGLRPNPQLNSSYGSTRFISSGSEYDFSAGVSQTFETGGKRGKRVAVAQSELNQVKAEMQALDRQVAADIRAATARALAAGKQLDVLELLIAANGEQIRIIEVRLKEGDVAPLDVNLFRNEVDALKARLIRARSDLAGEVIGLRALIGYDVDEPLKLAPLPDRTPRLDLRVADLTDIALRERFDLQAARLAEAAGDARIALAKAQARPNVTSSLSFSQQKRVTDLPASLGVAPVQQVERSLTFGVTVDLPFFNRNQGQIAAAAAARAQARSQREFLEAMVKRDVALAYNRYHAAAETLVLYATQIVPRSEANLQAIQNAYKEGELSIFDILSEQRRLIENQTALGDALRDYYSALAELERAIGTTIPPSGFAPP